MDKLLAEQIKQALAPWRETYRRDAWRPVISTDGRCMSTSKFGGVPQLAAGEAWPRCGSCTRPLHLFLQLDLSTLPRESPASRERGVLQMFYCASSDEPYCDGGWEPFSKGHFIRVLDPERIGNNVTPIPDGFEPFSTRHIVDWERLDDYPSQAEHDQLGIETEYEFKKETISTSMRWPAGKVAFEKVVELRNDPSVFDHAFGEIASKDKLGGWPFWVQGVEYPSCPQCGTAMEYLFQIDSEDNVPYMFGDSGCGHITQCPNHPEVLAFGWACY